MGYFLLFTKEPGQEPGSPNVSSFFFIYYSVAAFMEQKNGRFRKELALSKPETGK